MSTRGDAPVLGFEEVLLTGLATDGGLYVPEEWPQFSADDIRAMAGLSYVDLATRLMTPFLGGAIPDRDFAALVADAYAGFDHPAMAPLRQLDHGDWLMELFHGPTLAFKDYPLQLLGRLFDYFLARRGERITIIGATSGDTGSAAIEACRDRPSIEIFILHPKGRVSEVQRRQMTTVDSPNVHNLAVEGTFDDCQDLLKAMFNDAGFRESLNLSAVNSINWARIMAQTVYYFAAAVALGGPDRKIGFSVPTGNFGNVFAGYGAGLMGLPIDRLIVSTNSNDILTRFFETGKMVVAPVEPTLSPSMDIQVSSNFERLLFDMYDRDASAVAGAIEEFRATGAMDTGGTRLGNAGTIFAAGRLDDMGTCEAIADVHRRTGELLDPHTAVGVAVGRTLRGDPGTPLVSLATAHPAKFPDAVERAIGVRPPLPPRLAGLMEREERFETVPNALAAVQDFIRARVSAGGAS